MRERLQAEYHSLQGDRGRNGTGMTGTLIVRFVAARARWFVYELALLLRNGTSVATGG